LGRHFVPLILCQQYFIFITANNGIGIWLDGGSNNRIVRNDITDNTRGVFITATKNSTIYYNNFVNNTFPVDIYGDDPVISMWDNGSQGNHWDDYTGIDSNGDGMGDTHYIIDENNQDNYPFMNPVAIPEFPSPSPEPASTPASTPTSAPTSTPYQEPRQTEFVEIILAVALIGIVVGVGVGLLVYFKKRKKESGDKA
jgi:parallel beta-helix repeat protein